MKALVYTRPEHIEVRDVPDPEPLDGELLISIEAVGICGSDMHAYLGHDERRPAPLILGHEAAGIIAQGPRKGERVTVNPLVTCGTCGVCLSGATNLCAERQIISMPPREGAFAGLLRIPERNVHSIAPGLPPETAALAEPLACGWHAIALGERASRIPAGEMRAVVLGGGAIGLGAALVLADRGTPEIHIAETNPARHEMLSGAGPFAVYVPGSNEEPRPGSADLVIDAFGGNASRAAASALVRPGGVIVHIGLADADAGLDIRRTTLQEIAFIGSYTYTATEFAETVAAIGAGRLGHLDWIECRPLDDGQRAFADLRSGATAAAKIILQP